MRLVEDEKRGATPQPGDDLFAQRDAQGTRAHMWHVYRRRGPSLHTECAAVGAAQHACHAVQGTQGAAQATRRPCLLEAAVFAFFGDEPPPLLGPLNWLHLGP